MENIGMLPIETPTETLQLKPQELEIISNPSLNIVTEEIEIPNVIYGRMLSGRPVNKQGIKNVLESLWQKK